jgi:hypothetical protein
MFVEGHFMIGMHALLSLSSLDVSKNLVFRIA